MDKFESLSHTAWDCKYHVIFIPKCRRRTLYGELRRHLGEVFRKLAAQKESEIVEGHLMPDHVHMMIAIPPKYAVSQVIGFIKGKSAIHLARVYGEKAQLRGAALLGTRLLCLDGWPRRGCHTRVHQEPRAGGRAVGPTRPMEVSCHRTGGPSNAGPR